MTALCRIEERPAFAYSVHIGQDKLTKSPESQTRSIQILCFICD